MPTVREILESFIVLGSVMQFIITLFTFKSLLVMLLSATLLAATIVAFTRVHANADQGVTNKRRKP